MIELVEDWPLFWRRAYYVTWPVSLAALGAAFAMLVFAAGIKGFFSAALEIHRSRKARLWDV